jgi:hypothetical protein
MWAAAVVDGCRLSRGRSHKQFCWFIKLMLLEGKNGSTIVHVLMLSVVENSYVNPIQFGKKHVSIVKKIRLHPVTWAYKWWCLYPKENNGNVCMILYPYNVVHLNLWQSCHPLLPKIGIRLPNDKLSTSQKIPTV